MAARMIGVPDPVILFPHLLPNVLTPAIIIAAFGVAAATIGAPTLSYLGVGIQPPAPTRGNMLLTASADSSREESALANCDADYPRCR